MSYLVKFVFAQPLLSSSREDIYVFLIFYFFLMNEHSFHLSAAIEALLLTSGEPLALLKLAEILDVSIETIDEVITTLNAEYSLGMRGIFLIRKDGDVFLVSHPNYADIVEKFIRKEREGSLSKAALETLSIVAYRGPVSRSEIESIRGVNCTLSLRTLLLRGLVERCGNPEDARGYLYSISMKFLESLGLSHITELPDFDALSKDSRLEAAVAIDHVEKSVNVSTITENTIVSDMSSDDGSENELYASRNIS